MKNLFFKKKFNFLNVLEWENLKKKLKNFDIIINATSLRFKKWRRF